MQVLCSYTIKVIMAPRELSFRSRSVGYDTKNRKPDHERWYDLEWIQHRKLKFIS